MKEKKPQKQLLQFVMLSLLSVVSVLVMASGSYAATNCATCHGDGINKATGQIVAGTDMRPYDSTYRNISTGGVVGSHSKHMTVQAPATLGSGCTPCHNTAGYTTNHRTGVINLITGVSYNKGAGVITFTNQTSAPVLGTCAATCHNAYGTTGYPTPTWGVAAGCNACHNAQPSTGDHTKHLSLTGLNGNLCGSCHAGAVDGSNGGGVTHADGIVNVTGTLVSGYATNVAKHTAGTYTSTCATSCHNPTGATAVTYAMVWGGAVTCGSCHAAQPTTGDHTKHLSLTGLSGNLCGTCHTGAVNGTTYGTFHGDGNIDVAGTSVTGYTANVTKHNAPYASTCTTICHNAYSSVTAVTYAMTWGGVVTCNSCHAAQPTTGDHTKHLALVGLSGNLCATCHTGAVNGSSYGTYHGDGNIDVGGTNVSGYTANVAKHAGAPYVGTCSTTCHNATGTTAVTLALTWGSTSTCNSCHAAQPTTGDHTKHLSLVGLSGNLCATCHAGAVDGSNGGTNHGNGFIDVGGATTNITGYPANVVKHTGAFAGTCSTNCHNPTGATAVTYAMTWGGVVTCGSCHAAQPTTGDHTKHLSLVGLSGNLCGTCHTGAVNGTTYGTFHGDGNIDVAGTSVTGYTANVTKHNAPYASTCTTACHNPTGATAVTYAMTWGGVVTCGSCHAAQPTTGDHTKHLSLVGLSGNLCGTCHTGAVNGTTYGTFHGDGNIDVAGTSVTGYTANVTKHTGAFAGTCSTSCHNAYAPATPVTYAMTWGGVVTCGSCHAAQPTTGDHTKHLSLVGLSGNLCGTCHAGAVDGTTYGTNHGDGNVDVVGTNVSGYTANVTKHAGAPYAGTCSTTCHNAYSAVTPVTYTMTWGGVVTCGSCHAAQPTTGDHTKHLLHTTTVTCGSCHVGAINGTNGGTFHGDGNIDVAGPNIPSYPANIAKHAAGGYSSCAATCHNGPQFTTTAKTWGTNLDCSGCHGYPGSPTNATITAGHPVVAVGSCNACHNNVNAGGTYQTATIINPIFHLDGVVQGGQCDSCHGYPPVAIKVTRAAGTLGTQNVYSGARFQNYSGGGGVHNIAAHLNPLIKPAAGFGIATDADPGCAACHVGTSHNNKAPYTSWSTSRVQVVVAAQYKFDKNRAIVYNAKQSGTSKTTGTCSNVSCHYQKSPVWSSQPYAQSH